MSSQFLRHPLGSVCNSRLASWAMNLNHGKNSYKALGMSMIIHNHLGRISLIWQPQWGISHLSLSYIVPIARSPDCPSVVGGGGCALAYEMMVVVAAAVGEKGRRKEGGNRGEEKNSPSHWLHSLSLSLHTLRDSAVDFLLRRLSYLCRRRSEPAVSKVWDDSVKFGAIANITYFPRVWNKHHSSLCLFHATAMTKFEQCLWIISRKNHGLSETYAVTPPGEGKNVLD